MTQEKLISYYEKNLEKVKSAHSINDFKGRRYVIYAMWQLRAVKNGRKW